MTIPPLPGEGPRAGAVRAMFDRIAPSYDLLNRVMTLRVDQAWRRRLLSALRPRDGEALLDLCAGTMDVAHLARRRAPGLRVVGADFSFQMLHRGVEKTRLPAAQADALALPFRAASFDLATVTFGMRNLDSWETGLAELARHFEGDVDMKVPRLADEATSRRFGIEHTRKAWIISGAASMAVTRWLILRSSRVQIPVPQASSSVWSTGPVASKSACTAAASWNQIRFTSGP